MPPLGMSEANEPKRRPRPGLQMKAADFIARNPIFGSEEFVAAHTASGRSPATSRALLRYHARAGRILSLRRGLYAKKGWVDPWVLGCRLASDAVIAYDGALSFHGLTGLGHGISYLTAEPGRRFVYNEVVYLPVKAGPFSHEALLETEREGQPLTVTSRERTLVDLLDRLDLAPKPAELWRHFDAAGVLDLEAMVRWARRLSSGVLAARLGFFLENRKGTTPAVLLALERLRPRSPAYFDRAHRRPGGIYLPRWNLVVPPALFALQRT